MSKNELIRAVIEQTENALKLQNIAKMLNDELKQREENAEESTDGSDLAPISASDGEDSAVAE